MTDKAMNIDEAKRIVKERYADAHSRQYEQDGRFIILRDYSPFYVTIDDSAKSEHKAWLSAASRIQKEKDK